MHIGSGLNTVSSMYRQQKGNNMKTPASGEKTFYTAETPKVYQIFTTDNMLWTGGASPLCNVPPMHAFRLL